MDTNIQYEDQQNLHYKYPSLSKEELKRENQMLKRKMADMEKRLKLQKDEQYITFNKGAGLEENNSLYDTSKINFYEEKLQNMKKELLNFDVLECEILDQVLKESEKMNCTSNEQVQERENCFQKYLVKDATHDLSQSKEDLHQYLF